MAHFFGAVSEIRTSGLIPSWLGSSAFQPEEQMEEKKNRHDEDCDYILPVVRTLSR